MAKLIDLTGQRFGRLTVMERAENAKDGHARWLCKCDCGGEIIVVRGDLRDGKVKSCGCLRKETAAQIGASGALHGKRNTRLYSIWHSMKARCYNPKHKFYKIYGERGIIVCREWLNDFQAFYDWAMSHGYSDGLTIDRIDNNKGYAPENCRWATQKEQCNNLRTNRHYVVNGETRTLPEWCELFNIDYGKAKNRLRNGWSIEEALDLVPRKK